MIGRTMDEIKNHFTRTVETGTFTIANGVLQCSGEYVKGQYVRLIGPVLSPGVYRVHCVGDGALTLAGLPDGADETFSGAVYGLAPPPDFLELVREIEEFSRTAQNAASTVTSVTLPSGYHETRAVGRSGGAITWKEQYGPQLAQYRRAYDNPQAEIKANARRAAPYVGGVS